MCTPDGTEGVVQRCSVRYSAENLSNTLVDFKVRSCWIFLFHLRVVCGTTKIIFLRLVKEVRTNEVISLWSSVEYVE
jgi:hypothetical protein